MLPRHKSTPNLCNSAVTSWTFVSNQAQLEQLLLFGTTAAGVTGIVHCSWPHSPWQPLLWEKQFAVSATFKLSWWDYFTSSRHWCKDENHKSVGMRNSNSGLNKQSQMSKSLCLQRTSWLIFSQKCFKGFCTCVDVYLWQCVCLHERFTGCLNENESVQ